MNFAPRRTRRRRRVVLRAVAMGEPADLARESSLARGEAARHPFLHRDDTRRARRPVCSTPVPPPPPSRWRRAGGRASRQLPASHCRGERHAAPRKSRANVGRYVSSGQPTCAVSLSSGPMRAQRGDRGGSPREEEAEEERDSHVAFGATCWAARGREFLLSPHAAPPQTLSSTTMARPPPTRARRSARRSSSSTPTTRRSTPTSSRWRCATWASSRSARRCAG